MSKQYNSNFTYRRSGTNAQGQIPVNVAFNKKIVKAEDKIEISVSIENFPPEVQNIKVIPKIGTRKWDPIILQSPDCTARKTYSTTDIYSGDSSVEIEYEYYINNGNTSRSLSVNPLDKTIYFRPEKNVRLIQPSIGDDSPNKSFWQEIKDKTIDFTAYKTAIDSVMDCNSSGDEDQIQHSMHKRKHENKNRLPFIGVNQYSLLKFSTEVFLKLWCGFDDTAINRSYLDGNPVMLPYLSKIIEKLDGFKVGKERLDSSEIPKDCFAKDEIPYTKIRPFLVELIYNYWHEEGFFNNTLDAISARFQNIRRSGNDPLARLDIDPLRPLNNILWGYIQDSQHRLNSVRRKHEYDHEYGLQLIGKGGQQINTVDSRSKFIEAFHNLLFKCTNFYKVADDMTKYADGFPVLNALKEVHLLLAEGAHNQFGDLPVTARCEILMEQWVLSRPEIREFLGGKVMYPYTEPWMDRVDSMKNIQGWTDTSISYFNNLGKFGEQIILSIRYDDWSDIVDASVAGEWALFWRNEIQQYIHSYFAVSGVDLSAEMFAASPDKFAMPSMLIQRKLIAQTTGRNTVYYNQRY